MTNSADGPDRWSRAVGTARLLGFPGAGGTREGEVIRYAVLPAWIQPTTIGELDGRFTLRLERLLEMFRQSGFPVTASADMGSWLVSHVAVVSPLANAIYLAAGHSHALASDKDTVRLAVDAIREGFNVVRTMGLRVTPSKLRIFEVVPAAIVVGLLQAWTGTRHFETVAASHALAAHDEMQCLAREFEELVRKSNIRTPAIDRLREACEAFEPQAPGFPPAAAAPQ